MNNRMTKDDARKWMEGWADLEARERDLLQSESPEDKLRALAFLMASVDLFDLERLRAPLEALMRWFSAAGLRAAIIGGVAASLLGKPRLTKDIDAVIKLGSHLEKQLNGRGAW